MSWGCTSRGIRRRSVGLEFARRSKHAARPRDREPALQGESATLAAKDVNSARRLEMEVISGARRFGARAVPTCAGNSRSVASGTPWPASKPFMRFVWRPRSRRANRSSRCTWRRSSSPDVGTRTTLHTLCSPPSARMSMVTSFAASRRSVLVRRRRQLTSMLEESTTRFTIPRLVR